MKQEHWSEMKNENDKQIDWLLDIIDSPKKSNWLQAISEWLLIVTGQILILHQVKCEIFMRAKESDNIWVLF